jgi:hypothetical protein
MKDRIPTKSTLLDGSRQSVFLLTSSAEVGGVDKQSEVAKQRT